MRFTLIALALLGLIALATSGTIDLVGVSVDADDKVGEHDNSGVRKVRGDSSEEYGGYGGYGNGGYGGYDGYGGYGDGGYGGYDRY